MRADLLLRAAELTRSGSTFAIATVVRREPASSAQVGNMALIDETGTFQGWLGGSCIQPTVVREAMAALDDGKPRLVSLSPDPDANRRDGVTVYPMTCHSGGSVDIYIEPVLPAPRLLIFGVSPAAQALARLGAVLGYAVDAIDPEADRATFPGADRVTTEFAGSEFRDQTDPQKRRLFAVVATLGQRDEEATMSALSVEPAYLGVVASRKRFAQIADTLKARGIPAAAMSRITNPAGIDIGARSPEEIALSILAEIVRVRHAAAAADVAVSPAPVVAEGRDPICGMTVSPATAKHRAEYGGRTFYFCCGGCREKFLSAPDQYAPALTSRGPA
jgi:xanthine dehydrogenase accessory factor